MLIASLSSMLFIFPLENISVSSFNPNDRKWASGSMAEAVETEAVVVEVSVAEKSRRMWWLHCQGLLVGWWCRLQHHSSYCFFCVLEFPLSVSVNVFAFQQVVNFKCLFLEKIN